jgi:glycosyltransferase involved in cell wall biosynthesis
MVFNPESSSTLDVNRMKKRGKICIIGAGHWSAVMGGLEYQLMLLVEKLKMDQNYELFFITHNVAKGFIPKNYKVIKLKTNRYLRWVSSIFDIKKAYFFFKQIKPHVIYQRGDSPLIYAAFIFAKRFDCKLIWHVSSDSNLNDRIRKIRFWNIKTILNKKFFDWGKIKADLTIVQTVYQSKLVREKNNATEIKIIRNFHPFPPKKKCHHKKNQIIWVGNFKKLKRPEIFIELAKEVLKSNIGLRFFMIGSPALNLPKYQNELEQKIKKNDNLIWLKKQPIEVVNEYIEDSKIFINTSKWEGFPNTYIQAWMRETPTITLSCDPDNLIKNYQLGLHSKNFEKMVKDITSLLQDDDKRKFYGQNAKNFAFKFHSMKNLDDLVESIKLIAFKVKEKII